MTAMVTGEPSSRLVMEFMPSTGPGEVSVSDGRGAPSDCGVPSDCALAGRHLRARPKRRMDGVSSRADAARVKTQWGTFGCRVGKLMPTPHRDGTERGGPHDFEIGGEYGFETTYRRWVTEAVDGDVFVEVGVCFGRSIAQLCRLATQTGKRIRIVAVDQWDPRWFQPETHRQLDGRATNVPLPTPMFEFTREAGGPFSAFVRQMLQHVPEGLERIEVVRAPSARAARLFDDGSVRFVMLDASHVYEDVRDDLGAWLPKIRPGGELAGDDFDPHHFPGVVRAVRERLPEARVEGYIWRYSVPGAP